MGAIAAVEAALTLARDPSLAAIMRKRRLPDGVVVLLRVLAEEPEIARSIALTSRCDESSLMIAAEYYVKAVMLYPGAPPERVLGVPPGATRAQMRSHMRLLMVWLHPDRSGDDWRAAFAHRVLDAWRDVASLTPDSAAAAAPDLPMNAAPGLARRSIRHRRRFGVRPRWIPEDSRAAPFEGISSRARQVLLGAALVAALVGGLYFTSVILLAPDTAEGGIEAYSSDFDAPAARPQAP